MKVYVLEYVSEFGDCEDIKRVGVYASSTDAKQARERASLLPGFCEHPDRFHISEYDVGRDHWTSGFVTIESEGSGIQRPTGSQAA